MTRYVTLCICLLMVFLAAVLLSPQKALAVMVGKTRDTAPI